MYTLGSAVALSRSYLILPDPLDYTFFFLCEVICTWYLVDTIYDIIYAVEGTE